jgi:ABC-2 type transport system ATP-binding protein
MKIATTYLPPTKGTVVVNGYDVQDDPIAVRKNIGYLPEHNPLYLDMYVHEYLNFIGSLHTLKGVSLSSRVKEVVGLFGLTPEQNKKIGSLSKGFRQRVGLAQALVHDPKVLILDEPTSGLDPNQLVEIRNLIREISKSKTVIFSTHIMQEVQALCSRVIIIDSGKIVADNPLDSLPEANNLILHAEFLEHVSLEEILNIPGVAKAEESSPLNFIIQSKDSLDIRPQIFQFASSNNKIMIGLKQEENSLEKVFQKLTKSVNNV